MPEAKAEPRHRGRCRCRLISLVYRRFSKISQRHNIPHEIRFTSVKICRRYSCRRVANNVITWVITWSTWYSEFDSSCNIITHRWILSSTVSQSQCSTVGDRSFAVAGARWNRYCCVRHAVAVPSRRQSYPCILFLFFFVALVIFT